MTNHDPSRGYVFANTLPFDFQRPLRHPTRDLWGTPTAVKPVYDPDTGESPLHVTVRWETNDRSITKPLAWFLRPAPFPQQSNELPPDPEGENDRRASFAQTALGHYASISDANALTDDPDRVLRDFLADVRHWCDRMKLNYGDLDRRAYHHYREEISG